jgi:hypothetical protein
MGPAIRAFRKARSFPFIPVHSRFPLVLAVNASTGNELAGRQAGADERPWDLPYAPSERPVHFRSFPFIPVHSRFLLVLVGNASTGNERE